MFCSAEAAVVNLSNVLESLDTVGSPKDHSLPSDGLLSFGWSQKLAVIPKRKVVRYNPAISNIQGHKYHKMKTKRREHFPPQPEQKVQVNVWVQTSWASEPCEEEGWWMWNDEGWPTQTRIKVQILQQKKIEENITIIIIIITVATIVCSGAKLLQLVAPVFNNSLALQLVSLLLLLL